MKASCDRVNEDGKNVWCFFAVCALVVMSIKSLLRIIEQSTTRARDMHVIIMADIHICNLN